ncbi:hypothetical protein ScPMuIL_013198 [Solemya velum]
MLTSHTPFDLRAVDVRLKSLESKPCDGALLSWGEGDTTRGDLACGTGNTVGRLYSGRRSLWVSLGINTQRPTVVWLRAVSRDGDDGNNVRVQCRGFLESRDTNGETSGTTPAQSSPPSVTPGPSTSVAMTSVTRSSPRPSDKTAPESGSVTASGHTDSPTDPMTPDTHPTRPNTPMLPTTVTTLSVTTHVMRTPVSIDNGSPDHTQGDDDGVTVVGAVLGTVALIVCVVVSFAVWRRRQHKFRDNNEDLMGLQVEWTERKGVEITGMPFDPIPAPSLEPFMWGNQMNATRTMNVPWHDITLESPIYELAGPIDVVEDNGHASASFVPDINRCHVDKALLKNKTRSDELRATETHRKPHNNDVFSSDDVTNNIEREEDRNVIEYRHGNVVESFENRNYDVSDQGPPISEMARPGRILISTEATVHLDAHGNNCTEPAATGGVDTERHGEQIPCDPQTTRCQELEELKNDLDELLNLF